MSISQSLFGTTYNLPESRERKWGATVTAYLQNVGIALDAAFDLLSNQPLITFPATTATYAASATLTPATIWHRIAGTGAAVTLSATTAIANGNSGGQLLVITGTDGTNTVTILNGANTRLNGTFVCGLNDSIVLIWDSTLSDWVELFRNN